MPDELLRAFGDTITKPIAKAIPLMAKIAFKKPFKLFKKVKYSKLPHIPIDGKTE